MSDLLVLNVGDKESYWLAFELAGFPYHFVEHYAGGIGNDPHLGHFCSDHPFHFIPDKEASETQKKNSPGRPAWFNGSLLSNKGRSEVQYMNETSWAVGGAWTFHEDMERWCLPNSTHDGATLETLGPSPVFDMLLHAALDADAQFESLSRLV